ncbi:hypothetical protein BU54_24240 [Escherichia coli O45:H2 str. 2010C-4211]|nr:hypothetical protein BU54_24240 [Escherichia coli O45:H2 str. 2010C-4211]
MAVDYFKFGIAIIQLMSCEFYKIQQKYKEIVNTETGHRKQRHTVCIILFYSQLDGQYFMSSCASSRRQDSMSTHARKIFLEPFLVKSDVNLFNHSGLEIGCCGLLFCGSGFSMTFSFLW